MTTRKEMRAAISHGLLNWVMTNYATNNKNFLSLPLTMADEKAENSTSSAEVDQKDSREKSILAQVGFFSHLP